ncbi:hypothetical protein HPB51_019527 [Rhipicephalus microplus]|uniref:Uncharacterized protein n=1 Tax=Rhipicephalus microplus TaxID=6941 RepID=A0A9J6F5S8_RHIMP|nr:hypothetical protein HPB51_019527 [Rhipicephalus microplus]
MTGRTVGTTENLQRSSSSTDSPSRSRIKGRLSPSPPSDEQRMLASSKFRVATSEPEMQRQRKASWLQDRADVSPAVPVDVVVNATASNQRMSSLRRLSHFKRGLLVSGVTLSFTSTILLVLTWKLLQEPLGDDLARNVSHMALIMLPAQGALRRGVTRVSGSSEADNETVGADEVTVSPASANGAVPLF